MALLTAKAARERNKVTVDLGDGTEVIARRDDMSMVVLDGRLPLPLLAAVENMVNLPDATNAERLKILTEPHDGVNMATMLREHAMRVCINPRVVPDDSQDEDAVPIGYFSVDQLMVLWISTAVVPEVTLSQATRFRGGASTAAPDDVPNGADVRPAAEPVVVPTETEVISG
jgi:hypothetical protein